MEEIKVPFSGQIAFINTEMYWPLNHMVSDKEHAVQCTECHTRDNSRLASLKDFYMPARDYSAAIETGGTLIIFLTLIGILAHGVLRIVSSRNSKMRG